MLTVDYSKKILHVAIGARLTTEGIRLVRQGIVFNPAATFSKLNTVAERIFNEFFQPGEEFRIACIETEMGPGEMVKIFGEKFGCNSCNGLHVGGMISPFSLPEDRLELFWRGVTNGRKKFFVSREKKIWTRTPLAGISVRV